MKKDNTQPRKVMRPAKKYRAVPAEPLAAPVEILEEPGDVVTDAPNVETGRDMPKTKPKFGAHK
jgi:hypothetical protein